MKFFTLENNKPVITPELLLINEFKNIWERDESKNKEVALSELTFIYFLEVFDSKYLQYEESVREDRVLRDILSSAAKINKFNKKDELIIKGREKFRELQNTVTLLLYNSMMLKLAEAKQGIDSIDLTNDTEGKKFKAFMANIKIYETTISSINKIKEMVVKEMTSQERLRGQGAVNPRELPKSQR